MSWQEDERNKKYNKKIIISEKIGNLLGISAAIVCDGKIVDEEIKFLQEWLMANDEYMTEYPMDKVKEMMNKILEDGVVSDEEKTDLLKLLNKIAVNPQGDPVNDDIFTQNPKIELENMKYVITGEFIDDLRDEVIEKIIKAGGIIENRTTKETNYIVVGALGSSSWKHGNFGLKIKDGLKYQKQGIPIQIIRENDIKLALLQNNRKKEKTGISKLFNFFRSEG